MYRVLKGTSILRIILFAGPRLISVPSLTINNNSASSVCHYLRRMITPVRNHNCLSHYETPSSSSSSLKNVYLIGFLGWLFNTAEEDSEIEIMEDKIVMKIKRAILAIQREQYPKAENYLNVAYQMSEQEKLEDAKTQIIDIQANLSLQLRDFKRAESLFKLVAQRLVNSGRVDAQDNSIIEISIKLAEIYKATGKLEEAKIGYQYCVDIQREKIKKENKDGILDENTSLLYAWALHGLGQMQISLCKGLDYKKCIQESMKLIREAYKFAVDAVGSDSHQAVVIQSDIATVLALIGELDLALTEISQATEIAKDKYEDLYPNLKVNIGNLFLQKGEFSEAERHCKEAGWTANSIQDFESIGRSKECIEKVKYLRKQQQEQERIKKQAESSQPS